jgi:hypothetical protein
MHRGRLARDDVFGLETVLAQASHDLVRASPIELVPRRGLGDHHLVALHESELARPVYVGPVAGVLLQAPGLLGSAVYQRFKERTSKGRCTRSSSAACTTRATATSSTRATGAAARSTSSSPSATCSIYPGRNCTSGYLFFNASKYAHRGSGRARRTSSATTTRSRRRSLGATPAGPARTPSLRSTCSAPVQCAEGYFCDLCATADEWLEAHLCEEGFMCDRGTGAGQARGHACPVGYLCPTGTGDPTLGVMATDALRRGIKTTRSGTCSTSRRGTSRTSSHA